MKWQIGNAIIIHISKPSNFVNSRLFKFYRWMRRSVYYIKRLRFLRNNLNQIKNKPHFLIAIFFCSKLKYSSIEESSNQKISTMLIFERVYYSYLRGIISWFICFLRECQRPSITPIVHTEEVIPEVKPCTVYNRYTW